ncbi:CIR protein PIR protein [Plasmodium vinckei]|uniref:CIR protein PIR protein n=1 Tax=Plasmodium vinckei TaxID=5860 RepID=A0A6V7TGX8_PLAVN|nr:CIR protein PIR protein [Plasmodium vinckei]
MAKYSIEDLYKEINTINGYFGVQSGGYVVFSNRLIHIYCRYLDSAGYSRDYLDMASSGVIYVLKTLKEKYNLEDDKLAEYAILWLRYKLNQKKPHYDTQLNEFYSKYIEKNKYYDEKIKGNGSLSYKEIIDTKKDLMNIKKMTKFSYPFKILLFLYSEINKNIPNCTKHSGQAKEFVKEFEELKKDSNNIEDSSYNKMLSRLSDDYNNLKNKYNKKSCNFPSLPQLTPKKSIAQDIVENPVGKSGQNSLESSANGFEKLSVQTPEVTSSSSSISTTLIPTLSIFSIITVFLGISYKTIYKKKIKKSKEEIET